MIDAIFVYKRIITDNNYKHLQNINFYCIFEIRELQISIIRLMNHKNMRPQDIVILMKLMSTKGKDVTNKQIASELGLSASEVSEALERCRIE